MEDAILRKIARQGSDKEKMAAEVMKNPEMLSSLFEGLKSDRPAVKYGCEKTLHFVSERKPERLYPHFDFFIRMLDSENSFIRWGAILTIANLTKADTENKFEKIFDRYFSSVSGPEMIAAANTIRSAAVIAPFKPHLVDRMVREILKVEGAKYKTKECVNVTIGHAITAFDTFYEKCGDREPIIAFVKRQLMNARPSVRKRAEKFLKKHKVEVRPHSPVPSGVQDGRQTSDRNIPVNKT